LFRETADTRGLAQALLGLGRAALRAGAAEYAETVFAEALLRWKEVELRAGMVRSLSGLAACAAAQGHLERAVRLYSTATHQAEVMNVLFSAEDAQEQTRTLAALRDRLGASTFEDAWSEGEATGLDTRD
jgi:hypothetical protein